MSGRYQPAMLKYFEQFSARNVCTVIQASMLEHKKQVNSASRWLVIIKMMLDKSILLRTTTMTMMIVMMLKEKSFVSSEADQMDWVSKGCHLICCLAIDWKQTTSAVLINIITIRTGTIIILYIQHYIQQSDNIPSGSQLTSWLSFIKGFLVVPPWPPQRQKWWFWWCGWWLRWWRWCWRRRRWGWWWWWARATWNIAQRANRPGPRRPIHTSQLFPPITYIITSRPWGPWWWGWWWWCWHGQW